MKVISIVAIGFLGCSAFAQDQRDAVADLNIKQGAYEVISKDNDICLPGLVSWEGKGKDMALFIGIKIAFSDFNAGPKKNTNLDQCEETSTTVTKKGIVEESIKGKCSWGNYTSESKIKVDGNILTYTFSRVSSDDSKMSPLTANCQFKLKGDH